MNFCLQGATPAYVHRAITDTQKGVGTFHALPIDKHVPSIGDVIHHNRLGHKFDYEFAASHKSYESHAIIVVEVGEDHGGRFALCIGGNESDSIRRTVVRLRATGFISQRTENPFICVIKTLK